MKRFSNDSFLVDTVPISEIIREVLLRGLGHTHDLDYHVAAITSAAVGDVFNVNDFMPRTTKHLNTLGRFPDGYVAKLTDVLHTELTFLCYVPMCHLDEHWETKHMVIVSDAYQGTIITLDKVRFKESNNE